MKVKIENIFFDIYKKDEALSKIKIAAEPFIIFTSNGKTLMNAHRDRYFADVINSASLNLCDGDSVSLLYHGKAEKLSGVDFGYALLDFAAKKDYNVFMLGSYNDVLYSACKCLKKKYPQLNICGTHHGFFEKNRVTSKHITEYINACKADLLLVFLGSPLQEKWVYENKNFLSCKLIAALGGAIDIYSGRKKRAPRIFLCLKLEWLYRTLREPKRFFQTFKTLLFITTIFLRGKDTENES